MEGRGGKRIMGIPWQGLWVKWARSAPSISSFYRIVTNCSWKSCLEHGFLCFTVVSYDGRSHEIQGIIQLILNKDLKSLYSRGCPGNWAIKLRKQKWTLIVWNIFTGKVLLSLCYAKWSMSWWTTTCTMSIKIAAYYYWCHEMSHDAPSSVYVENFNIVAAVLSLPCRRAPRDVGIWYACCTVVWHAVLCIGTLWLHVGHLCLLPDPWLLLSSRRVICSMLHVSYANVCVFIMCHIRHPSKRW
jgi:hypothetical protein